MLWAPLPGVGGVGAAGPGTRDVAGTASSRVQPSQLRTSSSVATIAGSENVESYHVLIKIPSGNLT